jgi:hypothetical protein
MKKMILFQPHWIALPTGNSITLSTQSLTPLSHVQLPTTINIATATSTIATIDRQPPCPTLDP